ncbi:MFS transporter [Micromonospora sp. RTGN7]|uniref:MFS transporter n=1 Tax=Micromonospora sp. RTGN7 TaxID=3016526 RepID=UPI0029FF0C16|nr:MFS transporter [Micromonospora sp. RTGN7]
MADSYRTLLESPDTRRFVIAAAVARLPMSMLGIATLLLVTSATDSYSLAGAVCATILTAQALGAPYIGRLTDRKGQGQVLLPTVLIHTAGLAGLLLSALWELPVWTFFVFAAVAGAAFPPIGSLVRARWAAMVGGTASLKSALSVEAAIDEMIYIIGPALTTVLSASIHSAAGFATGMVFTLLGGLAFAAQRRTQPPVDSSGGRGASAVRIPGVRVILLFCVTLGVVLGSVEVSMVGFAEEQGRLILAGPLVAAFSVGSLVTGLYYGSRQLPGSPVRRFQIAVLCLGVGTIPLLLAPNLAVMALSSFIAGAAVAPTLIVAYEIVQLLVPADGITAGFAWVQTALGVGLAIGAGSAGQIVEFVGGRPAFAATVVAGLLGVAIVLPTGRILRVGPTPSLATAAAQEPSEVG